MKNRLDDGFSYISELLANPSREYTVALVLTTSEGIWGCHGFDVVESLYGTIAEDSSILSTSTKYKSNTNNKR